MMAKVTVTVEGEPGEARVALLELLGIEAESNEGIHSSSGESTTDWTTDEMARLWGAITEGAQSILAEVAKKPNGYPLEDLKLALGFDGQEIGGRRSSIGFGMREFPDKPYPVDFDGVTYRMDTAVAAIVRDLANQTAS